MQKLKAWTSGVGFALAVGIICAPVVTPADTLEARLVRAEAVRRDLQFVQKLFDAAFAMGPLQCVARLRYEVAGEPAAGARKGAQKKEPDVANRVKAYLRTLELLSAADRQLREVVTKTLGACPEMAPRRWESIGGSLPLTVNHLPLLAKILDGILEAELYDLGTRITRPTEGRPPSELSERFLDLSEWAATNVTRTFTWDHRQFFPELVAEVEADPAATARRLANDFSLPSFFRDYLREAVLEHHLRNGRREPATKLLALMRILPRLKPL